MGVVVEEMSLPNYTRPNNGNITAYRVEEMSLPYLQVTWLSFVFKFFYLFNVLTFANSHYVEAGDAQCIIRNGSVS
jgi:hypothetical protein